MLKNVKTLPGSPLTLLALGGLICGLVAIISRDGRPVDLSALLRTRRQGLRWAFTTVPRLDEWRRSASLAAIYLAVALPLGLWTGFLRPGLISGSWRKFVLAPIFLFIQPGLLEELFFRGLLLPHPTEKVPRKRMVVGASASLLAFILYHPINGLTFTPAGRPLFTDLAFLAQAGLLGSACTLAYFLSGSIWPPVLMHWLPVTVWILFFGGAKRVGRAELFSLL